ncbi:biopolymer transporter ExbD [Pseudoalteromonas sp. SR44-5]|uniref:biopolymer transporter ExbD n=1 Tax=unclassified Pseudoalteromonas TaxID=194690 RepID=UPI0016027AEB|nr:MULTISPECIES: biopolymer transporter ExbD [unclassified Pseudoalteromonas]MBB1335373.1 biopolymer transporter ExbD [Pseudoalteromonas sp. SR41-6]MBB1343581.1 biopolymer transporter ExbD [Pseudoalteromonas sp. SR45-6]MBB1368580.1 biopolymer transporter ExbD [Pseudoalteromonas sp. SR44-5]MBB1419361.1 biopolymer transporter ExbD [Pseudoalteromonas sp. SG44-1]MBB1423855.1 biopolymer transporter ExbD [Pseudoalteromonas sp. SG43-7]
MAFSSNRTDSDELQEQHEINVTPFIDVMLVLLIIFMVAAPLATVSVPVKLPAVAAPTQPKSDDPTYLTLQQDLTLILGEGDKINQQNLAQALKQHGIETQQQILIRADSKVEYGQFMALMNQLTKAGYSQVALVGLEHETDVAQ